jgi:transcription initiation factor TFIIH subunit 2
MIRLLFILSNIFDTINEIKQLKIRVSVICTCAELYICKRITEDTGGSFHVAANPTHLNELLSYFVIPSPDLKDKQLLTTDFIYMGFPKKSVTNHTVIAYDGNQTKLVHTSYMCPRCLTRCTELPTECNICHLQLTSSSHIARSHHHLFPVPNFDEIYLLFDEIEQTYYYEGVKNNIDKVDSITHTPCLDNGSNVAYNDNKVAILTRYFLTNVHCYGCCDKFIPNSLVLRCPNCKNIFCVDCDLFVHDSLHNCPGC